MFEPADRRRIMVAGITTLAMVPVLFGARPSGTSDVAAIGPDVEEALGGEVEGSVEPTAVPEPKAAESGGDDEPVEVPGFLIGPPPATHPTVVRIAVPASGRGNLEDTTASFRRLQSSYRRPCLAPFIEAGTELTVQNLHNGLSTTCKVAGGPGQGDAAPVVLDAAVFAELDDLAQAPIPVRISW